MKKDVILAAAAIFCALLLVSCEGTATSDGGGTPVTTAEMQGRWLFEKVSRSGDTCDFTYDPWGGLSPHYLHIEQTEESVRMGDCGEDESCDFDFNYWNTGVLNPGIITIHEFAYDAIDLWDATGIECVYWAHGTDGVIRFSSPTRATMTVHLDFHFEGAPSECAAMNDALKAEWPGLFPDGVRECSEVLEVTLAKVE